MKKKGRIVQYTAQEIDAMLARGEDQTDWAAAAAKTDAQIAADTASDEAWNGIPHDWAQQAAAAVLAHRRPRENKRQVTVRLDADILAHFRQQGRGWQTRLNAVLRSYLEQRKRAATEAGRRRRETMREYAQLELPKVRRAR